MAFSGEPSEYMVPRDEDVVDRIYSFWQRLGWTVTAAEEGRLLRVSPVVEEPVEGIAYWQTDTAEGKAEWFIQSDFNTDGNLSLHTIGWRLPRRMELVERPVTLPSDKDLDAMINRGGELLQRHTHIPRREHAGRLEIRFTDPFLFGMRVTGPKRAEEVNYDY